MVGETPAKQEGGLELRARLITVPFNDMPAILYGKKRITNLPETGYIRTFTVNLKAQVIELMVIDMSYAPVVNLGDLPSEPASIAGVAKPVTAKKSKQK
jgi:hypothetical protein